MDLCTICNPEGGAFAAGRCVQCSQLACSSHLVVRARIDSLALGASVNGGSILAEFAGGDREVEVSGVEQQPPSPGNVHPRHWDYEKLLRSTWVDGTSLCTACRLDNARAAVMTATIADSRGDAAAAVENVAAAEHARSVIASSSDPWKLAAAAATLGEALPEDYLLELWRHFALVAARPTHDLVQVTRTSRTKAVFTERGVDSLWEIGEAGTMKLDDSSGGPSSRPLCGYIDPGCFLWIEQPIAICDKKGMSFFAATEIGGKAIYNANTTAVSGKVLVQPSGLLRPESIVEGFRRYGAS